MGRRQILPEDAVNPLQRMLGTYLRLERTKLGYSSGEVATRLHLSDTYLRLAESGRATFNPSRIFDIIEVFADSRSPSHATTTLRFDRLAQFMVGVHWVGAEMSEYKGSGDSGHVAFEALARRDSDFEVLYERTEGYFRLKEEEQRRFLEGVAAPAVGAFLTARAPLSESVKDEEKWSQEIFKTGDLLDIPTLNVDILLDLKRALADRPFVHTAKIAARWERERASQFRLVSGLFRKDTVVSSDNLNEFHYTFLAQPGFQSLRLIFTDTTETAGALKKRFFTLLAAGRQKAQQPALTNEERQKVHFITMTRDDCDRQKVALASLRERGDRADGRENYWSFETQAGLHIGFVGHPDDNPASTLNLTLRESFRRRHVFDALWSNVQANG